MTKQRTPTLPSETATDETTDARPSAQPAKPGHDEWLLDEALRETFPASDPIAPATQKDSD